MVEDPHIDSRVKPLRIYLVEDSPIIVALLRDLVAGEATLQIVGQSAHAGTAVKEIVALTPDVAIVDIALEESSGFEVLRHLSAPRERRPVLIVLSNFSSPRYRHEAKKHGADYFFDKNGEILKLLKTVIALSSATVQVHNQVPD